MAPNKRPVTLIVQDFLSSELAQPPLKVVEPPSQDDYWTWSEPTDVLSSSHIVKNLIASGKKLDEKAKPLNQAHNDYWAEATFPKVYKAENTAMQEKSEHSQLEPVDYWLESSYEISESDRYWMGC